MKKICLFRAVDYDEDNAISKQKCAVYDTCRLATAYNHQIETEALSREELRGITIGLRSIKGRLALGEVFVFFAFRHGETKSNYTGKSDRSQQFTEEIKNYPAGHDLYSVAILKTLKDYGKNCKAQGLDDALKMPCHRDLVKRYCNRQAKPSLSFTASQFKFLAKKSVNARAKSVLQHAEHQQ